MMSRFQNLGPSISAIGAIIAALSGVAAMAQTQPQKICDIQNVCGGSSTTVEWKQCMGELLQAEDELLNAAYQEVIDDINSAGFSDPDSIIEQLRSSQREWIEYRDTYCDFRFLTAEGGTIGGLILLDCQCTVTRDKRLHLEDDLPGS